MDRSGYDPHEGETLAASDKAYKPRYVAAEPDEDSSFDDLSDDEDIIEPHSPNAYINDASRSTTYETGNAISTYVPSSNFKSGHLQEYVEDPEVEEDLEYRVKPIHDATTPVYDPSQTLRSPSESPLSHIESDMENDADSKHTRPENYKVESKEQSITRGSISKETFLRSPSVPSTPAASEENLGEGEEFAAYEEQGGEENQLNEDFEGFERDEQPETQVDGMIADIFGESDAEEEEFEGFAENEVDDQVTRDEAQNQLIDQSSSRPNESAAEKHNVDSDEDGEEPEEFVSDFDKIMARKREELRRKRRRTRDIEFLNDSDDLIVAMISRMREAADEDRQLLAENKPATKKLSMVTEVRNLLHRADLKAALVENGMLSAITEWLSPLPGHTLPNLVIRDTMLSCLREFQSLSTEVLQESGIGKALMYLYKHPRETRENKDKAQRLINEWLRPIFNLTSDYRTLSKEERKQLDYEHLPKRRNIENENYDRRDINRELDGEAKGLLRPGDPGWVDRARVPQPSNKDYIIRPKWRVTGNGDNDDEGEGNDEDMRPMLSRRRKPGSAGAGLGAASRIQAHIRSLTSSARQRQAKVARAVPMSVEGRKMAL